MIVKLVRATETAWNTLIKEFIEELFTLMLFIVI